MFTAERLKSIVKSVLRTTKIRPYIFGSRVHDDITFGLPNEVVRMIFDVGANMGQTAAVLRRKYPLATIHCFEPNPECCARISKVSHTLNVHQLALGSKKAVLSLDKSAGGSDMFRLTEDGSANSVTVEVLDNFCKQKNIAKIDYLKIDTEGHDLEVIRGAHQMLQEQRIGIVEAEVSMNSDNKWHVGFFEVQQFMEDLGYRLFGIYEQAHEWPTNMPYLRRANVVYISPQVIETNKSERPC